MTSSILINVININVFTRLDLLRGRLRPPGVRAQTLYAYVSRGRVQVRPGPGDSRRSLYRAADIAALTERKSRSRKVSEVATGAISWGEPVLSSAITTVSGGRLFYRGRDAIRLAETETLESVGRLLRGGHGVALKRTERPKPLGAPTCASAPLLLWQVAQRSIHQRAAERPWRWRWRRQRCWTC